VVEGETFFFYLRTYVLFLGIYKLTKLRFKGIWIFERRTMLLFVRERIILLMPALIIQTSVRLNFCVGCHWESHEDIR